MKIKQKLANALNEKDVENIYREELLSNIQDGKVTSPYGCDGMLEAKNLRCLLEFKYDVTLKNKLSQCNVLIQCLYYLKKFENSGEKLPTTLFLGDNNECAAVSTASVVKYLSSEIDWKIAPSEAHKKNTELIQAMVGDVNVLPFVFDVDDNFHIKDVIEKIKDLSENVIRKIRVTPKNIVAVFDYFDKNIGDKFKLTTNQKANLFIQTIINSNENYIHPKKKNVFVTKSYGDLVVNQNLFKSFFQHFEGDLYSPKEKEQLTGLVDRLVEDVTRKSKGEFFTPTPFVDLSHKYISNTFGEDWKEKYVVWDSCWGTGNLTRDYKFKELYVSTLEQCDIDTAEQMGYNPEAVKFQYNFLNDDTSKLPEGLKNAIRDGKEIIFLINPPYATANNMGTTNGDHKGGVAKTIQNELMLKDGWGGSSQNLYAQFLYRIYNIQKINKNIKLCLFSPPLFLSGGSYDKFRNIFLNEFSFSNGFIFEARHFSDVSKGWGISFTIFNNGENKYNSFEMDLVDFATDFELQVFGKKTIYNTDDCLAASEWVRKEIKGVKTTNNCIQLTTSINYKTNGKTMCGTICENSIGYIQSAGNAIYKNITDVSLFSYAMSQGHGLNVIPENFLKVTSLFTARKCIQPTWVNCKDEYLAPNELHQSYEQFTYDSLVYALFNNSSQQSGLRQVDYKDKKWDIKNEFFWLSKTEMLNLGEKHSFDTLYKDAKNGDERFVYNKLFVEGIYEKLSPDAKNVLDVATELLKKSIEMRKLVNEEHPEYHLSSFDCGYAQLKLVWKQYFKEEFGSFREIYKQFENRMRPQVYELGFLKN